MADIALLLIVFGIPLLGTASGIVVQRMHYKDLVRREQETADIAATNLKALPPDDQVREARLLIGEVVIAGDYLKSFFASLKTLFGGRIRSLESLMERGRREAVLRLKEQARQMGAHLIVNVRVETASLGRMRSRKENTLMAEFVATGTAVRLKETKDA